MEKMEGGGEVGAGKGGGDTADAQSKGNHGG